MGSREVTAWAVSRLIGAVPVRSACRPAGPGTACSPSSCVSEACEYSGALLVTVKKGAAVGDRGRGRGRSDNDVPPTNVPSGADTDDTAGTCESCAA